MQFLKFLISKEGLKQLVFIALAMAAFIVLLYSSLGWITHHGSSVVVPNVRGKSINEAESILAQYNLGYEIMDSSYREDAKPLTILEMSPAPGDKVKDGRKIYVTINRATPPAVTMPDLIDLSSESAKDRLVALKLKSGNVSMKPDICKDCVIEQWFEGKKIKPGDKIPRGSVIDLVLGDGLGKSTDRVPDLLKMRFDEVKEFIDLNKFNLGNVSYLDTERNDTLLEVVRQNPQGDMGFSIQEGTMIDIWLRTIQKVDSSAIPQFPSMFDSIIQHHEGENALQKAIDREE